MLYTHTPLPLLIRSHTQAVFTRELLMKRSFMSRNVQGCCAISLKIKVVKLEKTNYAAKDKCGKSRKIFDVLRRNQYISINASLNETVWFGSIRS